MLERRGEECDIYLTHVFKHQCSLENPVIHWALYAMPISTDVRSDKCHTLSFFLTFLLIILN